MFGIPQVSSIYIYAGVALVSAGLASAGTYKIQQSRIESLKSDIANQNAANATKAIRLVESRIAEGEKIDARQKELADAEQAIRDGLVGDVNSLQSKVTDLSRRLRANSATAADSKAASKVGDLFQSCVGRYTELERFATEDRLAGLSCEQRYDSLRAKVLGAKK
jgi:wobble nucleotide-excising tRNase